MTNTNISGIITWLKGWFYDKEELDTKIPKVFYGTCSTNANVQVKEITTSSDYVLETGTTLIVKFTYAQTFNSSASNPLQLKVNNNSNINVEYVTGQKGIRYHWSTGEVVQFVYDGTNFVMVNEGAATTTYWGLTKLYDGVDSTANSVSATANAVRQAYELANGKADANHTHSASNIDLSDNYNYNDVESEIDLIYDDLNGKAESNHNHNGVYAPTNHTHDAQSILLGGAYNNRDVESEFDEVWGNVSLVGHTHSPSNYVLRQTITSNGVTVKVYSNDYNVYVKYSGTATLTANTNLNLGTISDDKYRPTANGQTSSYDYGMLQYSVNGIYGAVQSNGAVWIINKTSNTSCAVQGSVMYPLKSRLP